MFSMVYLFITNVQWHTWHQQASNNIFHMAEFSVSEYLTTYKFLIELGKIFMQIARNIFKF